MKIELFDMYEGRPSRYSCSVRRKRTIYYQRSSRAASEKILETADDEQSSSFEKLVFKANMLMFQKKWEALTKLCSCGLQMQEDAELYNMKGRAEGKLGHMELKIQLTQKAILLNPNCAVYYRNLGAAQYKLQRYQSAIESHMKAAQLEPNNPINYHNAGAVYFRLKRYDQAIVEFKKSLQLNKYQAHSFRWLGNCFKEKQLFKEALECYYRAYDMSQKQIDRVQIEKLEKCLSPWRVFFNNLLFC